MKGIRGMFRNFSGLDNSSYRKLEKQKQYATKEQIEKMIKKPEKGPIPRLIGKNQEFSVKDIKAQWALDKAENRFREADNAGLEAGISENFRWNTLKEKNRTLKKFKDDLEQRISSSIIRRRKP